MKAKTVQFRRLFEETVEEPFFLPKIIPSAEHVIQGIAKPELKPKPSITNRETALKARKTVGRTLVPTGFNGRHFVKRSNHEGTNIEHLVKRENDGNGLCRFCDFHDKEYGYCLIKRLNGKEAPCFYNQTYLNRRTSIQKERSFDGPNIRQGNCSSMHQPQTIHGRF
jgi:hypothetical protein